MRQDNAGHPKPLWAKFLDARRDREAHRSHREVPHRHGFVFGFPNCSAIQLDEFLDDSGAG